MGDTGKCMFAAVIAIGRVILVTLRGGLRGRGFTFSLPLQSRIVTFFSGHTRHLDFHVMVQSQRERVCPQALLRYMGNRQR